MKLHQDKVSDLNVITGYGDDHVLVNQTRHSGNLVVLPDRIEPEWASGGFDALQETDFAMLAALNVEIVLIGTGRRQRFPSPALLRPLIDAQIGMEIMDLAAACRTYNILTAEYRSVAAALIFDRD